MPLSFNVGCCCTNSCPSDSIPNQFLVVEASSVQTYWKEQVEDSGAAVTSYRTTSDLTIAYHSRTVNSVALVDETIAVAIFPVKNFPFDIVNALTGLGHAIRFIPDLSHPDVGTYGTYSWNDSLTLSGVDADGTLPASFTAAETARDAADSGQIQFGSDGISNARSTTAWSGMPQSDEDYLMIYLSPYPTDGNGIAELSGLHLGLDCSTNQLSEFFVDGVDVDDGMTTVGATNPEDKKWIRVGDTFRGKASIGDHHLLGLGSLIKEPNFYHDSTLNLRMLNSSDSLIETWTLSAGRYGQDGGQQNGASHSIIYPLTCTDPTKSQEYCPGFPVGSSPASDYCCDDAPSTYAAANFSRQLRFNNGVDVFVVGEYSNHQTAGQLDYYLHTFTGECTNNHQRNVFSKGTIYGLKDDASWFPSFVNETGIVYVEGAGDQSVDVKSYRYNSSTYTHEYYSDESGVPDEIIPKYHWWKSDKNGFTSGNGDWTSGLTEVTTTVTVDDTTTFGQVSHNSDFGSPRPPMSQFYDTGSIMPLTAVRKLSADNTQHGAISMNTLYYAPEGNSVTIQVVRTGGTKGACSATLSVGGVDHVLNFAEGDVLKEVTVSVPSFDHTVVPSEPTDDFITFSGAGSFVFRPDFVEIQSGGHRVGNDDVSFLSGIPFDRTAGIAKWEATVTGGEAELGQWSYTGVKDRNPCEPISSPADCPDKESCTAVADHGPQQWNFTTVTIPDHVISTDDYETFDGCKSTYSWVYEWSDAFNNKTDLGFAPIYFDYAENSNHYGYDGDLYYSCQQQSDCCSDEPGDPNPFDPSGGCFASSCTEELLDSTNIYSYPQIGSWIIDSCTASVQIPVSIDCGYCETDPFFGLCSCEEGSTTYELYSGCVTGGPYSLPIGGCADDPASVEFSSVFRWSQAAAGSGSGSWNFTHDGGGRVECTSISELEQVGTGFLSMVGSVSVQKSTRQYHRSVIGDDAFERYSIWELQTTNDNDWLLIKQTQIPTVKEMPPTSTQTELNTLMANLSSARLYVYFEPDAYWTDNLNNYNVGQDVDTGTPVTAGGWTNVSNGSSVLVESDGFPTYDRWFAAGNGNTPEIGHAVDEARSILTFDWDRTVNTQRLVIYGMDGATPTTVWDSNSPMLGLSGSESIDLTGYDGFNIKWQATSAGEEARIGNFTLTEEPRYRYMDPGDTAWTDSDTTTWTAPSVEYGVDLYVQFEYEQHASTNPTAGLVLNSDASGTWEREHYWGVLPVSPDLCQNADFCEFNDLTGLDYCVLGYREQGYDYQGAGDSSCNVAIECSPPSPTFAVADPGAPTLPAQIDPGLYDPAATPFEKYSTSFTLQSATVDQPWYSDHGGPEKQASFNNDYCCPPDEGRTYGTWTWTVYWHEASGTDWDGMFSKLCPSDSVYAYYMVDNGAALFVATSGALFLYKFPTKWYTCWDDDGGPTVTFSGATDGESYDGFLNYEINKFPRYISRIKTLGFSQKSFEVATTVPSDTYYDGSGEAAGSYRATFDIDFTNTISDMHGMTFTVSPRTNWYYGTP